jgi:hypothetical protein
MKRYHLKRKYEKVPTITNHMLLGLLFHDQYKKRRISPKRRVYPKYLYLPRYYSIRQYALILHQDTIWSIRSISKATGISISILMGNKS